MLSVEDELYNKINEDVNLLDVEEEPEVDEDFKPIKSVRKNREKEKEDIFSDLLRKRNNKFNKLWGTKILVKYDSRKEAKLMLKG